MQTITVITENVQDNGCRMLVDNKVISAVFNDQINEGRYVGLFLHGTKYGQIKGGMRYPDAIEFITDCIEKHFAELGLNVEFK